jgi:aquaglyceroporin related protein, other eukaryote
MSSTSKPVRGSVHRHNSSIDTTKYDDSQQERGGQIAEPPLNAENDYYTRYPNSWARIRSVTGCLIVMVPDTDALCSNVIREPAAEMLGTMMLTLVGTAANCQVVLSSNTGVASSPKGDYLSICFGWACSLSLTYILRFSTQ